MARERERLRDERGAKSRHPAAPQRPDLPGQPRSWPAIWLANFGSALG